MPKLLTQDQIMELHTAVLEAGLDRDTLLSDVDRHFVSSIKSARDPSSQLLLDLHELSANPRLLDGSTPLVAWLKMAVFKSGPRPQRTVFARILAAVEAALRAGASAYGAPASEARADAGSPGLLDEAPFPWHHPAAARLRDHLADAYPEVHQVEMLAKMAGLHLGRWPREGSPEVLWHKLLEVAASQGKTRALIDRVLSDPAVAGYHERIRACIARAPAA